MKFDLSNIPVCLITVSGGGLDEKRLYDLAYNTIEPQIERITGRLGRRRRRQDPADRRQPGPRPPLREGDLGPGRRAVGQRCELPHAVGDIRIGTVDYKLLTNNQFQLVKPMEDIVVRKVGDVPSASAISATCPTRTRRSRASSASTASAPSTCG